jgi:hypothetical protein
VNLNHSNPDKSAEWIDVKTSDIEYIVVVGSLLSQWTNHAYKAPEQRAVYRLMPENCVSISYSAEPAYNSLIDSYVPNEPDFESRYCPITYIDYKNRGDKLKLHNLPPISKRNYMTYINQARWKV